MSGHPKRPRDVIDLTADTPPPKASRLTSTQSSQRRTLPPPSNRPSYSQSPSAHRNGPAYPSYIPHSTQVARDEDEEEDGNVVIDLTQTDGNIAALDRVPVGMIENKVVGVRFYNGYATNGETVMLRREPTNQYDSNAIRVNNVFGEQIGHIPRPVALKLAPFMDSGALSLEAYLTGEKGPYDVPIRLLLYGTSEPAAKAELIARMRAQKMPLSTKKRMDQELGLRQPIEIPSSQRKTTGFTSSQSSGPSSSQPSSSQSVPPPPDINHFIAQSEQVRPRDIEEIAQQWGEPESVLEQMPMASQPDTIKATLLPYQLQGLLWMRNMENPKLPPPGSNEIVQLWKRGARNGMFTNIVTNHSTFTTPTLFSGGILADDMGLGKTLQIISLIATGGPGPTLIVAPMSVMSNWSHQIERHVKSTGPLRVLTYHGTSRFVDGKPLTAKHFENWDVVVTTYGAVSNEYMPPKSKEAAPIPRANGLFSLKWRRIVLDEGHTIRNPNAKMAVAATSLLATSKWVLSGTPIVNSIKDLYSMLKFLGITGGLENHTIFNQNLARPLAQGDPRAEMLVQSIMRTMCLRRKKDMKFVDLKLPELSEFVFKVKWRNDEKQKYDALMAEAQGLLHKHEKGGAGGKEKMATYRHILEILLRLRQMCCHFKLCGDRITEVLAALESEKVVELTTDNILALQALLQLSIESSEECPICLSDLHNPVITACKHVFGFDCIERTIELQHKCPMCRAELKGPEQLVHPAKEVIEDAAIDTDSKSSKTEALMEILAAAHQNAGSKIVIFSQWTSFLNVIQAQLQEANYKFTRIDGTMPAKQRDAAMTALEKDPACTIMLASLSVASVGLNLVAADTVVLADCWWAPAIEDQAVDRVHRLGQTRPTTVWRLVMEESIEERVVEIQKEKRTLVSKAFQEKGGKTGGKTRGLADIQRLLK